MPKSEDTPKKLVRLNKFISECGVCSRRNADLLIEEGKVKLNGRTTYEMGLKVDPFRDKVAVKGKLINFTSNKVYFAFNKPKGVLTTMKDPEGRPCIADFLKKLKNKRLFPVGRLDWDTEGLLLLTNDGEFAQKVTHPSEKVPKIYLAKLSGSPKPGQLKKLETGVTIVGGRVKALFAEKVRSQGSQKYDWVKIAITEGKNRQVKKMFEKIGFDVKKLKRVAIGQLKIGPLKSGIYAPLTETQVRRIFQKVSSSANGEVKSLDQKRKLKRKASKTSSKKFSKRKTVGKKKSYGKKKSTGKKRFSGKKKTRTRR